MAAWISQDPRRTWSQALLRSIPGHSRSTQTVNLGLVADLTLTEARTKLEAIVREAGSRPQSSLSITFNEYWQLYYKPRHRVSWSEPTEHGYDAYVRAYLNPAFGNVRLVDLAPGHVTAFFDRLRKEHSRHGSAQVLGHAQSNF